jgi:diguanylate cyclase (GGDEF)-like protein
MSHVMPAASLVRPRVMLAGEASARPQGLERALTRSGFLLCESADVTGDSAPDAVLITLCGTDPELLGRFLATGAESPPLVVLVTAADPDAPAAALSAGADDAVAAPVHLPDLCARLHARIRDRQAPRCTARERAARAALETMAEQVRGPLRPEEVVLAIVRRVARAFGLGSCAFVAVNEAEPRVIAVAGPEEALDPADQAALAEAARTGRAIALPECPGARAARAGLLAIPGAVEGETAGVLLLRQRGEHGPLSAAQLELAAAMASAAARAWTAPADPRPARSAAEPEETDGLTGCATVASLDRRLAEEFERARRYALSFSLVLLDVDALADVNQRLGAEAGDRLLRGMAARLRQELRLPDFLCRSGGDEFAILLPETGADGARRSVRRIRAALSAAPLDPSLAGERPGVSAGIVAYPHPAADRPDDLVALVEAGLARAKAQAGERIAVVD